MRFIRLFALLFLCLAPVSTARGAPLQLRPGADLNFGNIGSGGGIGFIEIIPSTGASVLSNAFQLGTANRGWFEMVGTRGEPLILSLSSAAWTCNTAVYGPCIGTPTLTLSHDFGGVITSANCPQMPRCIEIVNIGGRFSLNGTETGAWTTVITIIANYQ